jgi:hypothetical protein
MFCGFAGCIDWNWYNLILDPLLFCSGHVYVVK